MCFDGGYGEPDLRLAVEVVSRLPKEETRRQAAGHAIAMEIVDCLISQSPEVARPYLGDLLEVYSGSADGVRRHFKSTSEEIQSWVNNELEALQSPQFSDLPLRGSSS